MPSGISVQNWFGEQQFSNRYSWLHLLVLRTIFVKQLKINGQILMKQDGQQANLDNPIKLKLVVIVELYTLPSYY